MQYLRVEQYLMPLSFTLERSEVLELTTAIRQFTGLPLSELTNTVIYRLCRCFYAAENILYICAQVPFED